MAVQLAAMLLGNVPVKVAMLDESLKQVGCLAALGAPSEKLSVVSVSPCGEVTSQAWTYNSSTGHICSTSVGSCLVHDDAYACGVDSSQAVFLAPDNTWHTPTAFDVNYAGHSIHVRGSPTCVLDNRCGGGGHSVRRCPSISVTWPGLRAASSGQSSWRPR
eukprot:5253526-Prymnesium_polylepis.1